MKVYQLLGIIVAAAVAVGVTSCGGYTSRDNEVVGQVKRVVHSTPRICPDYYQADVSMGVLRNGVGSMSKEDMWAVVPDELAPQFKKLAESGEPVKVTYDVKRWTYCTTDHFVRSVEIAK